VLLACSVAQAQPVEPVWIVRDELPDPARVEVGPRVMRVGLATVGVIALGWVCARRRRVPDAREVAGNELARRLSLDDDDRALVREIGARAGGVPPVALLICESAMRRELARERRRQTDPGRRAHLNRIEAKVLG